ncbi:response regulator [Cecembia rubra]|uniref:Hpt domain-containing protein n=1 Tax=Cecembia rubra TaxID=1485585 RepID=A0A2P8DRL5_9BACT|nr:response regulator [Cecembia rubra]PSK99849.1 Hpt domain-containing protein [Cecembia rubra]
MKNKKVLIADDNALNRRVFQNIISQVYQFDLAENGKEVIEKLQSDHFDVILLDIQMPQLDGIHTLKAIKERQLSNAPIVAVSAFAEDKDREYFLSAGFDDFISKPIKPKQLLETINDLIKKSDASEAYSSQSINQLGEAAIIDNNILIKLLKFNSIANIKVVYDDFISETEKLLDEIEYLIKYGDFPGIGEKLHIIKGNSGTLGAMQLYNFSQTFERNIKSGNFDNTLKDYIYLKTLFETFKVQYHSSEYLNP